MWWLSQALATHQAKLPFREWGNTRESAKGIPSGLWALSMVSEGCEKGLMRYEKSVQCERSCKHSDHARWVRSREELSGLRRLDSRMWWLPQALATNQAKLPFRRGERSWAGRGLEWIAHGAWGRCEEDLICRVSDSEHEMVMDLFVWWMT